MTLVVAWHRLHRWPRRIRGPLKMGGFLLVVLVVLYPKPWLLPGWMNRLRDLDSVLDPQHPALEDLARRAVEAAGEGGGLSGLIEPVERVVLERIPYAFDWDTWGVMDYLPTVDEVFAQGREDCDGQAVVAASVLRRLGYDAWLVSDLMHTWVVARDPHADSPRLVELMSPGRGEKTLTGEAGGTRPRLSAATVRNSARALAFGVAVFPVGRELVIVAALWLALIHPRSSLWRRVLGAAILLLALVLMRNSGGPSSSVDCPGLLWLGLAAAAGGCGLLVYRSPKPSLQGNSASSGLHPPSVD